MKIDVSIVIPAYNEQKIIATTLQRLADFVVKYRQRLGVCEVIVSVAGNDRTAEIAQQYSDLFEGGLHIVTLPRPGKGRQVQAGMLQARGAVRLFMDADLATPLRHMLPLVDQLQSGQTDVVIGVRNLTKIHTGIRAMLSVASNLLIRSVLFPGIRDTQCGFKGFTAEATHRIFTHLTVMRWGFDLEMLQLAKEARYRVAQIDITDWREARKQDLRGDRVSAAAMTTLRDLVVVRTSAWMRSLARHWVWWVCAGMAVFFGLSIWIGLQQSVWFDEAYSITLIQQPIDGLLALTNVDAHPPLYYLLLKGWAALFGDGELALRSFSALCGALAAGSGVWLVRRLFGVRAALMSLLLVVLAPFLLRYGFEIRMYALASLISIVATHALVSGVRAQTHRAWYWAAYAALVALGMFTLYYTAFVWIAHVVWLLATHRSREPKKSLFKQPWLAAYVGSVALFAPYVPTFYDQFTHSALSGVAQAVTFKQIVSVISLMFSYLVEWQLDPWSSLVVVAVIGCIVALIVQAWRVARQQTRSYLGLLLAIWLVPLLVLLVLTLPPLKPMFLERYLSHTVLAGYLLVGASLAVVWQAKKTWQSVLMGMFLVGTLIGGVCTLGAQGNFTFERVMRPHARDVARSIGDCDQVTIIANDPLLYFELKYYLPNCDLRFFNNDQSIGTRGGYAILHDSDKELYSGQSISTSPIVYYVTTGDVDYHLSSAFAPTTMQQFEKFRLIRYE